MMELVNSLQPKSEWQQGLVNTLIEDSTGEVTSADEVVAKVTTRDAEEAAEARDEQCKTAEMQRALLARVMTERRHLVLLWALVPVGNLVASDVVTDARCQKLRYYNSTSRPSVRQSLDFRSQPFDTSALPPQLPHAIRDMKKEENRLKSFDYGEGFTARQYISVRELAADGFFYLLETDRVKCAFCKGILREWLRGESPREAHRLHYSTCPFVLHLQVGNVPIADADADCRLSTECSETSNDTSLEFVDRIWSRRLADGPEPLLRMLDDSPELLAFRRPRSLEGQASADATRLGDELQFQSLPAPAEAATEAAAPSALANLDSLAQKFRSEAERQLQHPQYRRFLARKRSLQSSQRMTPAYQLAKAGFCCVANSSVCCYWCGLQLLDGCPSDPWPLHARYSPRCGHVLLQRGAEFVRTVHRRWPPLPPKVSPATTTTTATTATATTTATTAVVSQKLVPSPNLVFRVEPRDIKARADLPLVRLMTQLSFTPQEVRIAVELHLRGSGRDFESGELFLEDLLRQRRLMKALNLNPEEYYDSKMQESRRIQELVPRDRESQDWKTCKVCMDKEVNVVLLNCGHLCCCSVCAKNLPTCPMCRGFITATLVLKE